MPISLVLDDDTQMTLQIPQIVIDTNVLIAAQRSKRGASSKLMSLVGTGRFDIHISVPLVLEYEAILLRQRVELGLNPEDVAAVVDALCALVIPHQIYFLWRPYLRDRKDELVLELAVTARCNAIITFNQRDFIGIDRFGIRVLDPRTFLHDIGERQ
jgi:putative PIN family toxin of toxin-antitoxin system